MPTENNITFRMNYENVAKACSSKEAFIAWLDCLSQGNHYMFSALNNLAILDFQEQNGLKDVGELRPAVTGESDKLLANVPSWESVGAVTEGPGVELLVRLKSEFATEDNKRPNESVTFYPASSAFDPATKLDYASSDIGNRYRFIAAKPKDDEWEQVRGILNTLELGDAATYVICKRYGREVPDGVQMWLDTSLEDITAKQAPHFEQNGVNYPAYKSCKEALDAIRGQVASAVNKIDAALRKARSAVVSEQICPEGWKIETERDGEVWNLIAPDGEAVAGYDLDGETRHDFDDFFDPEDESFRFSVYGVQDDVVVPSGNPFDYRQLNSGIPTTKTLRETALGAARDAHALAGALPSHDAKIESQLFSSAFYNVIAQKIGVSLAPAEQKVPGRDDSADEREASLKELSQAMAAPAVAVQQQKKL